MVVRFGLFFIFLLFLFGCLDGGLVGSDQSYNAHSDKHLKVVLYKDPYCSCCDVYVSYLEKNGFNVEVVLSNDMLSVKRQFAVPSELYSCHTAVVGDVVVEGHVPVEVVLDALGENVSVSLPGMPLGSPGMGGKKTEPFVIYAFDGSNKWVYKIV